MRLLASLLFCLLLSGCNEDQLILRFDVSVAGESGPGINATLERALRAALVSQQIDAQRIGVRRLDGDGLAVSFSGAPLSAAERQRLQDYIGAILAARAAWNERVRLELQMERLDAEYMALMPEGEVRALLPTLRAALGWIRDHGDSDGDGFLDYIDRLGTGLSNQGWKDSGDSIQWRDGRRRRAVMRPGGRP